MIPTQHFLKKTLKLCATSTLALMIAESAVYAGPPEQHFSIETQQLSEALLQFSQQSDMIVIAAQPLVRGLQAPSVEGVMAPQQALVKLLEGSGLSYRKGEQGQLTVVRNEAMKRIGYNTAADYRANLGAYVDDGDLGEGAAFELDEIIVTASRREQNLQDVPMAITAVRPEEFTAVGLTRLSDIIAYTPGVSVSNPLGTPVGATITARGVGQQSSTATVGVYMDSVPLTSNSPYSNGGGSAFDGLLGDVERVEFLKGPQGTLYGSTSIGGAVKYITRKPSLDEFRGHASVDLSTTKEGGFNQVYNGRISTPLIEDKIGITVAGFYEDNGGLVDRVDATGVLLLEDADTFERYGFSGDLYYQFSDRFDFRARVLHQKANYNGTSQVDIDEVTKELKHGFLAGNVGLSNSNYKNTFYTGTFEYQFDGATLTATSSYVEDQSFDEKDIVVLARDFVDNAINNAIGGRPQGTSTAILSFRDIGSEKFTQEIQLTSEASETWEWMLGLYYADETTFQTASIIAQPGDINFNSSLNPSAYKEYAAFGNLTYYITPEFDVTVGARLSHNQMTYSPTVTSDITNFGGPSTFTVKDTVDTWSFAARYRPTENMSLYARAASGYRPAFANQPLLDVFGNTLLPVMVESDSLWSYEVGTKGSVAEGVLSYDLSLWYLKWNNFQTILTLSPTEGGFSNAPGGITAKGIEGSFTLKPVEGLSVISNFAYTDSTLNEDEPFLNGLEGQQLAFVPKWTFSSRANYGFTLSSDLDATIGAGIRYESSNRSVFTDAEAFVPGVSAVGGTYDQFFNIPTDAYVVVDFNAGMSWDQISLNFYVTNLLNEGAITSTFGSNVSGFVIRSIGVPIKPRTIGAKLSVNF